MESHAAPLSARAESSTLAGDLWGGLAAMLVALPSSIAFGVVVYSAAGPGHAADGALAGIIGAAILGLIAPLVSGNGGFITAPCAPAAAVMSGFVVQLAATGAMSARRIFALMALTALLCAVLQIVFGAIRAGRLIKFIPYQVVSGYLSGVAVIIAVSQIPKLLGVPGGVRIVDALVSPELWKWPGIFVGMATIVAMALAPRVTKKIPSSIFGLAAGTVVYFAIAFAERDLLRLTSNPLIIGPVRTGGSLLAAATQRLDSLRAIQFADLQFVLMPALTLAVLLSIDTLKTGVVLDALARKRHNSNRELVGQGVANAAAFFGGGMPGAGTMGATLVNFTSGGRTRWSGVAEGVFVILAFLLLGEFIAWVPIGALAGILLVISWRMFDFEMFRLLVNPSTRLDFVVIATVIIVAASIGLIQASIVGVCLAILLFIRDQIRGTVLSTKRDLVEVRSKRRRIPAENAILDERGGEACVVQLQGNLFFGTTDQLFTDLEHDLATRRFILLDLRRVQSMDYTAGHLFEQMEERLAERGGELLFSGLPSSLPSRQDIERYMAHLGVVRQGGSTRVFETRDSAIEWMEEQILEAAGWQAPFGAPPLELNEIDLFRDFDAQTLAHLGEIIEARSIPAGETIFSLGERGDEMFVVRKGRVHVSLPLEGGKRHHLATFCRNEFFGEMAFLDRGTRSADAEAATPTHLFVLSRDRFDAMAVKDAAFAARIFEHLAQATARRMRVTDAELQALEER